MKKDIVVELITSLLYVAISAIFLGFTASSKYEGLLRPGESICSVPYYSFEARVTYAIVSFCILAIPLFIRLVKNIIFHEYTKLAFTIFTLILLMLYTGWLYFGRYYWC